MNQYEPRGFPSIWSVVALIVALNLLIPLVMKLLPFVLAGFLIYVGFMAYTRRPW